MRKIATLIFAFVPLLLHAQLTPKSLKTSSGLFVGFYQYTPSGWSTSTEKYPVIIFLHGVGERGNGTTELSRVSKVALPKYINQKTKSMRYYVNGKWQSFVVLAPQLPTSYSSWQNSYVDAMIDYAVKSLKGDPNRIILTGLSMGGGGVWKYASSSAANAAKLAAIVPVCATCQMSNASNIATNNLAVWGFHSLNDPRVGVGCTKDAVAKINALGPKIPAIFTPYTVASHSIWDMAYDDIYKFQNPHVFEWMLGQNKSMGANRAPSVSAGADVSTKTGTAKAVVNGNATDGDGTIWKYIWRKVSGPSGAKMVDSLSKTLTVTGLTTAGTYVYKLISADNNVYWNTDEVKILVTAGAATGNVAPVANAGSDKTVTLPTTSVSLSGTGSSDADGTIASYSWTKVSGPGGGTISAPTAASTTISSLVAGTYIYRLTVKDNAGATDTDDMTIDVASSSTSLAPKVSAGADQVIIYPENSANVTASATDDGTISSYLWSQLEGPSTATISSKTSRSTALSALKFGKYRFNVKVTDNSGLSTSDQVYVSVKARPIAKTGADKIITGTSTSLSSAGSTDPDGTIVKYEWFQKSGPSTAKIGTPNGAGTTVSSLVKGVYFFILRVWDNDGYANTEGIYVTVSATSTANLTGETSYATEKTALTATEEKITAYPNPVRSTTNLTLSSKSNGLTYINVYDLNGKLIRRVSTNKTTPVFTQPLDMSGLIPGSYQVQAQINNTTNLVTRVIKQ
ncbi:MAG TPA: PKD domain-containing protein [Flavitalea sp.]|nr:PKD domain-containing protein [Flavitalea sp.]